MIKKILVVGMMLVMGVVGLGGVMPVMAADEFSSGVCNDGSISSDLKKQAGCGETRTLPGVATTLINVAIALIGLLAVVVIVYGGIRYSTSLGEPGKITQARHIIIYGVIGLVVAMLAWGIVNVIIDSTPKF